METHALFLFFPHLLWYQNKTQSEEDGILRQYFPVISGKKIGLIDLSPIRPTEEQLLPATALNMHSVCYNFHVIGEGFCQGLLSLVLSDLACHYWLS